MDKDLKEALDMLETMHMAVWTHFDPTMQRGAKDQPKAIRGDMKRLRAVLAKHGIVMQGFRRGE